MLTRLAIDEFRRGGLATVEISDLAQETVYIVQSFRAGRVAGQRQAAPRTPLESP